MCIEHYVLSIKNYALCIVNCALCIKNYALCIVHCALCIMHCAFASAQSRFDSIQHVDEVVVVARYSHKEVIPSQTLSGEQLEKLSAHSVADALRYFSGLQLKDYGGVGGIKTVNIRSMGTNHLESRTTALSWATHRTVR